MNKLGIYPFFLMMIVGIFVISRVIKKDISERLPLREYKLTKVEDEIISRIEISTVSKGHVYIRLKDGSKVIIGPSVRLDTSEKLYVRLSTGDSLIKHSYNDTLTVIKRTGSSEKFKLLF
ncbi:MAG TPA: hypothetical protein PLJ08_10595 [Cyclobacteriaceae bacterium]|nr:hypothetical protein [Cyclobacteriaceae bacterium]